VKRVPPGFLDEQADAAGAPEQLPGTPDARPHINRPELFDALPDAPGIIGKDWNPGRVKRAGRRFGSGSIAMTGLLVVIVGWCVASLGLSVLSSFQASSTLGSLALLVYTAGGGLIAYAGVSEWRALRSIRQVDTVRTVLRDSSVGLEELRAVCVGWLQRLADRIAFDQAVIGAIREADSREQIVSLLKNRLAGPLSEESRRIGRRVATEGSLLVAISPHQSWDGVIAALYGLRIIRQVAMAHGLRPSPIVSVILLRRTVRLALEIAAVELVAQSVGSKILENTPLLRHLATAIPGLGAAELRLYRLALVSGQACNPLAE
jgi:uncharacterized membrane protein YcjF (UPF0283 family)